VEQKGSLVHPDYLRFDFSHFQKVSEKEIRAIETIVNEKIRENLSQVEEREIGLQEALDRGATALFGEKYGNQVRLVQFGDIVELCGGTHVKATGDIGFFKILNEGAISAGIRRIEAITGEKAEEFIQEKLDALKNIQQILKSKENPVESIQKLLDENQNLQDELEGYKQKEKGEIKELLKKEAQEINGINLIAREVEMDSVNSMKDLAFQLKREMENLYMLLGAKINGKANLVLVISDNLVKEKGLHAGNLIKEIAKEIQGGGGGQPFLATAGGKNPSGLANAIERAKDFIQ
jgi:alanyl-tRNA synthetase